MQNTEYLEKINAQIQKLFPDSLKQNRESFNVGFDMSHSLSIWHQVIPDEDYKVLIINGIEALEVSMMSLAHCIYRNSFSSLRLSLEMLFGALYYSSNKLEYIEWTKNSRDLNWATINCFDNGVLSHRYSKAFFPELQEEAKSFHTKAKSLYRDLSEHVHGNFDTWKTDASGLKLDDNLNQQYNSLITQFREVITFGFVLRFLKAIPKELLDKTEPLVHTIMHHKSIQDFYIK